jgi:hypothetical protein
MVPKEVKKWEQMFATFFRAIFSARGMLQLVAVGYIMLLSGFLGIVPLIGFILVIVVYVGVFASYMFLVIGAYAQGHEELPRIGHLADDVSTIFGAASRFLVATAIVWVPLLFYFFSVHGQEALAQPDFDYWQDPILVLIIIAGTLYIPASYIIAALGEDILDVLNPLRVLGVITRLPQQYVKIAVISVILFAASSFLSEALTSVLIGWRPIGLLKVFLLNGLVRAISLIPHLLLAMILGRFIYQNAKIFQFKTMSADLVPQWPNAKPRGTLPAHLQKKDEHQEAPKKVVALELESTPQEALAGAIKSGNQAMSLEAYKKVIAGGALPNLMSDAEFQLANMLVKTGDFLGAAKAFHRSAQKDLNAPLAVEALYKAARLLTEKAGKRQNGLAIFKYILQNYPEHELAADIRQRMEKMGTDPVVST